MSEVYIKSGFLYNFTYTTAIGSSVLDLENRYDLGDRPLEAKSHVHEL
jgi:hypothetical protein